MVQTSVPATRDVSPWKKGGTRRGSRMGGSLQDLTSPRKSTHISRTLEEANDVESNPGPKKETRGVRGGTQARRGKQLRSLSLARHGGADSAGEEVFQETDKDELMSISTASSKADDDKIARLESEIAMLQATLETVDQNVSRLQQSVDQLRPIYNDAKIALGGVSSQQQKNNLVFYGIEPDPLEIDMMSEPDFCRDILETRIKAILRDYLKISRDISFYQVSRIHSAPGVNGVKPIVACFANWKDKENVLRQAKLLKGQGISITEDISNKAYAKGRKASVIDGGDSKPRRESDCFSAEDREEGRRDFASDYEPNSSSASGTE